MTDQSEFIRSLEKATSKMIKDCMENMETACLLMERSAKKNANVDQGTLRASIAHDVVLENGMIVGSIFSNLNYAPYVEKGTGVYSEEKKGRLVPWYVAEEALQGSHKLPTFQGKVTPIYGKNEKKFYKTDGMRPHPFLEPAREENKDKISKVLAGKSK